MYENVQTLAQLTFIVVAVQQCLVVVFYCVDVYGHLKQPTIYVLSRLPKQVR